MSVRRRVGAIVAGALAVALTACGGGGGDDAKWSPRVAAPKQYWRSQPREYKDLFDGSRFGQR